MRKKLFKIRIKLKTMFHSLFQLLVLLGFGYFNNALWEMIILYFCFFYFRTRFEKQFHASSMWGCTILTIIVYWLASRIIPQKSLSILLVIIFTYFINTFSFYARDYLDIKKPKKKKKNTNRQQIIEILGEQNLDEESIEKFCVAKGMPRLSETIYLFLNNTLDETSYILEVDHTTITRRIKKFIKESQRD